MSGAVRPHRYMSLTERFWVCVSKAPESWLWTGCVDKDGYGRIRMDGRSRRAHRVSYRLHRGPIPRGMVVMHTCDTPACVNPEHLRVGTIGDNNQDRTLKGRSATGDANASRLYPERRPRGERHHWQTRPETRMHGERNGRAQLKAEQVREIRRLHATGNHTNRALGRRFGVTDVMVGKIVRRLAWTHIED